MDEDSVQSYVDHAEATIEAAPQMDEANTKAAVLRDFLDLLDWSIPENTQLEYSVKAFGKTYKVDYALILEGTPVAFLEAKGVDTTLSDKHRKKLEAYLKNEDVNLGILTNGEEYEFYRREVIDTKVNVNTLGRTGLQSLPERVTTLRAFTKDAIQTNEWEKILNRIKELREARTTLEKEKDDLATEVAELFSERVSGTITPQTESQAKEMIDRLIGEIENEINSDGEPPDRDDLEKSPQAVVKKDQTDPDRGYQITFFDGENELIEFTASRQADVFIEAVDYLVRNHNLISELEPLPYIPGRTRPIIHDESSFEGKQMKQPRGISGGYYLEVNLSSGQKQRELARLAERRLLSVEFSSKW